MRTFHLGFLSVAMLSPAAAAIRADDGDPLPTGAKIRLGTSCLRGYYIDAMTPDGKYLVTAQPDRISLLDPKTGKIAQTRQAHGVCGPLLAFSQDGKRAVSGGAGTVFVWEVDTGAVLLQIQKQIYTNESSVSISADGKRVAIGDLSSRNQKTTSAEVWDVDQKKLLATFATFQNQVGFVALSPDGKRLATWDSLEKLPVLAGNVSPGSNTLPSHAFQLWDVSTGKEVAKVDSSTQPGVVVYSPTGSFLASSCGDGSIDGGSILVINSETGKTKMSLTGRAGQGLRLAISPDEKTIASIGNDGVVQRWNLADGKLLGTNEPPFPYSPRAIQFTDNERAVAWGCRGNGGFVWEIPSGKPISPVGGHFQTISGASLSPDGKEVVTASNDGALIRWNLATGKELASSTLKLGGYISQLTGSLQLSAGGKFALVPGLHEAGSFRVATGIYEAATGERKTLISSNNASLINQPIRSATFAPDGNNVLVVSCTFDPRSSTQDPKVAVWNIPDSKVIGSVTLPPVKMLSFSTVKATITPDGKKVVTIANKDEAAEFPVANRVEKSEFSVTSWDVATGRKLAEYTEPAGLTFSFVTATGDNESVIVVRPGSPSVVVIDLATGKIVKTLDIGDDRPSIEPVLSPDKKTIAIASSAVILLVDLESGRIKKSLPTGGSKPSVVSFSPDGKLLFCGSFDTTVLVWDLGG